MNSENGPRTWSSPAFLKRSHLPYASYFKKQHDPFQDESVFEESTRNKRIKLGRQSYQWTFADRISSPDGEPEPEITKDNIRAQTPSVGGVEDARASLKFAQPDLTEQGKLLRLKGNFNGIDSDIAPDATTRGKLDSEHAIECDVHRSSDNYRQTSSNEIISSNKPTNSLSNKELNDRGHTNESQLTQDPGLMGNQSNLQGENVLQVSPDDEQTTPVNDDPSIISDSFSLETIREAPEQTIDGGSLETLDYDGPQLSRLDTAINSFKTQHVQQILAEENNSPPPHSYPCMDQAIAINDCSRSGQISQILLEEHNPASPNKSPSIHRATPVNDVLISEGVLQMVPEQEVSAPPHSTPSVQQAIPANAGLETEQVSQSLPTSEGSSSPHSSRPVHKVMPLKDEGSIRGSHVSSPKSQSSPFIPPNSMVKPHFTSSVLSSDFGVAKVGPEGDSSCYADSTASFSHDGQQISPLQSPSPGLDEISDDQSEDASLSKLNNQSEPCIVSDLASQSEFGDLPKLANHSELESGDEIIYASSDIDALSKDYHDSQVSSSSIATARSSNRVNEDVSNHSPRFGLDGASPPQVQSSSDTLPLPGHVELESFATDNEPVGSSAKKWNDVHLSLGNNNTRSDKKGNRQGMGETSKSFQGSTTGIAQNATILRSDELSVEGYSVSSDVNATESGGCIMADQEITSMALSERPGNVKQEHQESGTAAESNRGDENISQDQQNHETQIVISSTKTTIEIIDLESEDEEISPAGSPLAKVDSAAIILDAGTTYAACSEVGAVINQRDEQANWTTPSPIQKQSTTEGDKATNEFSIITNANKDDQMDVAGTDQTLNCSISSHPPSTNDTNTIKEYILPKRDSSPQRTDADNPPQPFASAVDQKASEDPQIDPILRNQLFTPSASQHRSLISEPSDVSLQNQEEDLALLPTPRLTQSTSALPLPSITSKPPQKPSLVEKLKAIKNLSAKTANARRSSEHSNSTNPWFTHANVSQVTHISDSESEAGSVDLSAKASLSHEDTQNFKDQFEPPPSDSRYGSNPPNKPAISPNSGLPRTTPPGFRTSLSYFAPLSTLSSHFNTLTSILAIIHSSTSPKRSKAGPRDYQQSLSLTDPSSTNSLPTIAQIFRPHASAFPIVNQGDAVLLRNFKVQTFNSQMGLLSTDSSAWAVFRKGEEVQVRGPPVDFGAEERGFARGLWGWWGSVGREEKILTRKEKQKAIVEPIDENIGSTKARLDRGVRGLRLKTSPKEKASLRQSPASARHELRDGTTYMDGRARTRAEMHELRDGTVYADGDEGTPGKINKSPPIKYGLPSPYRRPGRPRKANLHELRDGKTYSDGVDSVRSEAKEEGEVDEPNDEAPTPSRRAGRPKKPVVQNVRDGTALTDEDGAIAGKEAEGRTVELAPSTPSRRVGRPRKPNVRTDTTYMANDAETEGSFKLAAELDEPKSEAFTPRRKRGRPRKSYVHPSIDDNSIVSSDPIKKQ